MSNKLSICVFCW